MSWKRISCTRRGILHVESSNCCLKDLIKVELFQNIHIVVFFKLDCPRD